MSTTIGKHWPHSAPRGDYAAMCDYCGVQWRRSQLMRDASGLLACPDDQAGRDVVTLNEGNAEYAARQRQFGRVSRDGANWNQPSTDAAPPFVPPNAPSVARPNGGPIGPMSVLTNLWVRSDALLLDTSNKVQAWPDQSSRNQDLLQATPSKRPSVGSGAVHGQPFVVFDGITQFLQATMFGSAPLWVWMIACQNAWTIGSALFVNGFGVNQNTVSPGLRSVRNVAGTSVTGANIGDWFRLAQNSTVAGVDYLTVGAVTVTDAGAGQRTSSAFSLGSGFNGAGAAAVSVAEVVVTLGPPTAAEIAALNAYGVAKYQGTLF